ncbi:MAG: FtsX-like permease family protein, partial [Proteobacteria bacterium]|nr:FtsX-like permease family protein [Pseudomonadota bacterium]
TRIEKFKTVNPADWTTYNMAFVETYVRLSQEGTASGLESKLPSFVDSVILEGGDNITNIDLLLQPMPDIRLNTDIKTTIARVSNPVDSYVLSGLGILVLLIACVNFITLSVGRSVSRAREVGVRKVMGAFQSQLRKQYLGEAALTTSVALTAGLALANLMLPTFNALADKQLCFTPDITALVFLIGLALVVSFAAGSYPAVILARFQPVTVLKGVIKVGGKPHLSKSLVVLQFSLSILLIIGTLVIKSQVDYLREKNLGYDQERVVEISLNSPPDQTSARRIYDLYRNELMRDGRILNVSAAMNQFGTPWTELGFRQSDGSSISLTYNLIDYGYLDALGIDLIEGRDFSKDFGTDATEGVIVNEALVKYFGWQDPLNELLPGSRNNLQDLLYSRKKLNVIG